MINKVILIGNLGQDPETKHIDGDRQVSSFSLATAETFKNKSGEKETSTQWHKITLWGKQSELAEKFLKKGSKIYLEGKIEYQEYMKGDEKRYATKIIGNKIAFLDSKPQTSEQNSEIPKEADDLPF